MDMIPVEEIKQMVEANELPATIRDTSHKVCTDLSTDVEQQSEATHLGQAEQQVHRMTEVAVAEQAG